ncbi:MAG: ABC transporter ATP-binding protein [Rubricoccaceae bacterium]
MTALAVHTVGLSKTYGGRQPVEALKPLDLSVEPGETFGLLGPNGAGKTTLVKLLLGLAHPTSGTGEILGRDIRQHSARTSVGYLPEGHRFPTFLTGSQALDLFARMAGVSDGDRRQRAGDLLDRVRLSEAANRKVGTYSKGMLQRLGIAQALMNRPQLVFLDEPTDGVDPVGRREIRDLLEELRGEGVAVFLNSHLLSEVERVCNRVAILKDGILVREGTVEALTITGRTWLLRSTPIPPETASALGTVLTRSDIPNAPSEDTALIRSTLVADDRSTLNAALDALRAGGVEIESVEPQRQSLEDLFVSVVSEEIGTGNEERGARAQPKAPVRR